MIYRECKITPEYVGFAWAHPSYNGPDDDGGSIYAGRSTTIDGCKGQIDDFYHKYDEPEDNVFELWARTKP